MDFLPFVKFNNEWEDEEGSGVSHSLRCEDEATVSKEGEVKDTEDKHNKILIYSIVGWQEKEFPLVNAPSAGAEKGMDYGNIHLWPAIKETKILSWTKTIPVENI